MATKIIGGQVWSLILNYQRPNLVADKCIATKYWRRKFFITQKLSATKIWQPIIFLVADNFCENLPAKTNAKMKIIGNQNLVANSFHGLTTKINCKSQTFLPKRKLLATKSDQILVVNNFHSLISKINCKSQIFQP